MLVSSALEGLIVTLPVPTALLLLVTMVVPLGRTSLKVRDFFVSLSTKVKSDSFTFSPTFLAATVMSYFSLNLLKSRALTV